MAVTFQTIGASYPASPFTAAATTTAAVPYPSGIAAGDALVLCAVNNNPNGGSGAAGTTFTTPSGWTAQVSAPGINTDGSGYLFTKKAVGTETGTLSVVASVSGLITAYILRYNGNDQTTPFGGKSSATSTAAQNGSPTHGTVSPAPGVNDMVVRMYGFGQDTASTGETLSSPAGTWTTRGKVVSNTSGAFQCGVCVADKLNGLDNQAVTVASGHLAGWIVAEVAIVAAASPPSYVQPVNRARLIRASCW